MLRCSPLLVVMFLAVPVVDGAEPRGDTHPWELIDCQYVYVVTPALSARVARYLPSGFAPATIERVPGPAVTQIAFEMEICAEGSGLDGRIAPMTYAQSSVPAIPPAALRVDNLGTYVKFHPLIPDDERREHFASRGMPAVDGAVEIGATFEGVAPGPFRAATTYDGLGTYGFDLAAIAPDAATGGEFTQYLDGPSGKLSYWRTNWSAETVYRVAGTATLPAASWEAAALGTTIVPVRGSAGAWSYTGGKVVLG